MFRVEIETDNAAFEGENIGAELATHLRDLARRCETFTRANFATMAKAGTQFRIRDTNGNAIGSARVQGIEKE